MSVNAGNILENASVRRVRDALQALGAGERVIALDGSARTAAEAAVALGCPVGAIVKSLVFAARGIAVMAYVAGDRQCDLAALGRMLALDVMPKRADADLVRAATGFAIGGVSPLGHPIQIRAAIDESLRRFDRLYAAAGHPYAVFPLEYDELCIWTQGIPGAIAAG